MAIINLKDVSKIYGFGDATTVALEDVGLEVEKGEFVAIMGPSGSGKTTLLNIIGLLDKASHGTYKLDGRQTEKLSSNARAKARRDKIGFVFSILQLASTDERNRQYCPSPCLQGAFTGRQNEDGP